MTHWQVTLILIAILWSPAMTQGRRDILSVILIVIAIVADIVPRASP